MYGTLAEPDVQRQVIGRQIAGQPDALRGWTLGTLGPFSDGASYPILRSLARTSDAANAAPVEGHVLTVRTTDLPALDEYEGVEYRRIQVRLESGVEAWVYVER